MLTHVARFSACATQRACFFRLRGCVRVRVPIKSYARDALCVSKKNEEASVPIILVGFSQCAELILRRGCSFFFEYLVSNGLFVVCQNKQKKLKFVKLFFLYLCGIS